MASPNIHPRYSDDGTRPASVASSLSSTEYASDEELKRLHEETTEHDTTWHASWKRYGPLSGLACLAAALISILISFLILFLSDGAPTRRWKFQPSTYIAIATAVANQAMRYAALQGIVIAWWSNALNGSTLSALHRNWDMGTSLWQSLIAWRRMNLFALVAIVSTLVAMDGPLLQRATTVELTSFSHPVQLNVSIVPELMHGSTGYIVNSSGTIFLGRNDLTRAVGGEWSRNSPINNGVRGCDGSCRAKIRAPMLERSSCTRSTVPYTPRAVTAGPPHGDSHLDEMFFYTKFDIIPFKDREAIGYTAAYREAEPCQFGHVVVIKCLLYSAIGLYPVDVHGSTIKISSFDKATPLQLANNTGFGRVDDVVGPEDYRSTLAGVAYQANIAYEQSVYGVNRSLAVFTDGFTSFAQKFIKPKVQKSSLERNCSHDGRYWHDQRYWSSLHGYNFIDPTDYIMDGLNELVFRMGFESTSYVTGLSKLESGALDEGLVLNQSIQGHSYGEHTEFSTNYWWFFAAALVELACVVCVAATYWNWWTLGREVSFSPLEIAKAFEAPLLAHCPSDVSAKQLAEAVGDRPVRYGAIETARGYSRDFEPGKIAFADPRVVHRLLDRFHIEQ